MEFGGSGPGTTSHPSALADHPTPGAQYREHDHKGKNTLWDIMVQQQRPRVGRRQGQLSGSTACGFRSQMIRAEILSIAEDGGAGAGEGGRVTLLGS